MSWPGLPQGLLRVGSNPLPTYPKPPAPLGPPAIDSKHYHLNTDRSAAVSTDTFYSDDMASCPRGVKLILLTAGGVAVLGHYTGDKFYVGWHALPRKKLK